MQQLITGNHPAPPALLPQEAGLDRLALLRLPQADYPTGASAARALHRRLRQLGGGSLREGLAVVAVSEEEQRSLAAALGGVEPEVGLGRWVDAVTRRCFCLPALCLHQLHTLLVEPTPLLLRSSCRLCGPTLSTSLRRAWRRPTPRPPPQPPPPATLPCRRSAPRWSACLPPTVSYLPR